MRKQLALAVALLGAGAVVAASPAQAHNRADGPRVAGRGQAGELVTFDAGNPKSVNRVGRISGLKDDMKVVGIDYRVQHGKLYAVGDRGGVYTVDSRAKASKVSQLTVALDGRSFGVDFNPAANRLRVISDTGQNLRHNLDDPNGAPALGVTGAGYTNNDLDAATATTLFDVDTTADQVSAQSPANAGNLAPTGKLGVDPVINAATDAGFDVHSQRKKGVTVSNTGYATLKVDGAYRFFTVDVLTGAATMVGTFPAGRQVSDIAVQLG
jgi:hypothetical protein